MLREPQGREAVTVVPGERLVDDDPTCFVDNVHPNEKGFAQYAERLLPYLQRV